MISMSDINAGLVAFVRSTAAKMYGENIPVKVLSNDEKTSERPSVRIFTDNIGINRISSGARFMEITCEIYFYTRDARQYRIENLKIAELFADKLLEPLLINDSFAVYPDNIQIETDEGYVICSFDISMLEDMPEDDLLLAEELENNITT